jgi:hypothetical protein
MSAWTSALAVHAARRMQDETPVVMMKAMRFS